MSSPSNARHRRMVALHGLRPCAYESQLLEMQTDDDEGRAGPRQPQSRVPSTTFEGVAHRSSIFRKLRFDFPLSNIFFRAENISDRNEKSIY